MRVTAATNQNLEACIKEKPFREDLYYRLKVIHIQMPSLREVPDDIPLLANHFLGKYCAAAQTEPKEFTPATMECLKGYPWPGNARQLENEIKRLVASVRGKLITEDHLDVLIRSLRRNADTTEPDEVVSTRSLPAAVEQLERQLIDRALRDCSGNKQKAAQVLLA